MASPLSDVPPDAAASIDRVFSHAIGLEELVLTGIGAGDSAALVPDVTSV